MGGTPSTDWVGRTLGSRYDVKRRLAKGGMGTVYVARDRHLERTVVIKVPRRDLLANKRRRDLFLREIEGLKAFDHPHVVRVLDKGEHEGMPFAVLQHCEGGSLEDHIHQAPGGAVDAESVLSWLFGIASALDVIHAMGIVHRDVKPGNILFDRHGQVCLSDFGVARSHALDGSRATGLAGSPAYMAPEQALGKQLTGAADQYSLAVSVYRALAGELPFRDKSVFSLLFRKQRERPRDLDKVAPGVTRAVAATVMQAMSKDAADRYPSCAAFATAFESAVRHPHDIHAAAGRRRARRAVGPRLGPWTWAAVIALAAAVPLTLWIRGRRERYLQAESPPRPPALPSPRASPLPPPREADATPPVQLGLDVSEPREGACLGRRNVHVAGSAEGLERGGTLTVCGAPTPVRDGRFETWIDAGTDNGPFALTVRVDREGEAGISVRRDAVIDTVAPVLELPETLSEHTIVGRVVDANFASFRIDGEAVVPASDGTFRYPVVFGSNLMVVLVMEARDLAGNTVRVEKRYRRDDLRLVLDGPEPRTAAKRQIDVQGGVIGPSHAWRLELNLYAGRPEEPDTMRPVPGARASIGVDKDMRFEMRLPVDADGPYQLMVELYSDDGFVVDKGSLAYVVDTKVPRFREILTEREEGQRKGVVIRGQILDENRVSLTCNGEDVRVGRTGTFTIRRPPGVDEVELVIRDAAGNETRKVVDLRERR